MYVRGIRSLFRFAGYVVSSISMTSDLVQVNLRRDGQGLSGADDRTLDVHCLRHTFATLLSKSGVVPRMAQELMRHSDIRLTMNTYTHLQLIDTTGAVETLPSIGGNRDDAGKKKSRRPRSAAIA